MHTPLAAIFDAAPFGGSLITDLLHAAGPLAVGIVAVLIFIENGLLFPFLPGDSLVFAAALLVVRIGVPLWILVVAVALAAVLGDMVGYSLGRRLGKRLFRPNARIFRPRYLDEADAFLARYGALALVLARFVPIVRTFMPPAVGASNMPYRRFLLWNIVGGVGWAVALCLAGYWLGRVPFIANNVDLIAVVVAVVSVLPVVISALRQRHRCNRTRLPAAEESVDVGR
ncbi:MAG TPA: VTT domain-containing protein [Galbitalea sp.]|nr:VTT domain-containing protein [Galbitalea sp.]